MTNITVKDIVKTYDNKVQVIHGINAKLKSGDFTVILGESGCGKSTLMRMIAGLEDITGGDLLFDGERMNDMPPKERGIGMVFQNYALYPHMTVFDNIAYGMKLSKIPKDEIEQRVSKVATMLNIEQYLTRKPHELSGGQRQRIAIGRAIVREPTIMLFDEPLSNLDATLRGAMRIELRKLHDRTGATSIFVTHDQVEAMTLADRILIMNKGVIEQIGTPQEIYHKPETIFVAGFIGSPAMNLITTTEAYTSNEIGELVSLLDNPKEIGTIGIRPEHVSISDGRKNETDIECAIDLIEDLGANKLFYCKFGACQITVSAPASSDYQVGSTAYLALEQSKINLFNRQGKRLDQKVANHD